MPVRWRYELYGQAWLLRDQCVVECGDTPSVLTLYQHYRKKRAVFSGEGARGRFEGALHMGQEDTRRDLSYSNHLITDDAALVNRVEDDLMSLGDCVTSAKVLAADVHEVRIFGTRPRESSAVGRVPRLLQISNEVRYDPLGIINIHYLLIQSRCQPADIIAVLQQVCREIAALLPATQRPAMIVLS